MALADELKHRLLGGEDVEAVVPADIEVAGLCYTVPGESRQSSPREVLSDIDCVFPPGRLSAIMGATGSGKTSLLTLLRGLSAPGSRQCGQVLCNGRPVNSEMMRSVSSFVPQDDHFLAALTPREMLSFAAELSLSSKWTERDRAERVNWVIELLKLGSCANTPIGDERFGDRGISGGERRRLSVGMAVIGGLPQALFCDEPTSGLDSAAAENMIGLLRDLAGRGVTVLCSIHQPSYAVFSKFSHLLLLEAGRTAYSGAVSDVEAYFAKHGSPTPEHTNPAHHYIREIQEQAESWNSRWCEASAKAARPAAAATASTPPTSRRRHATGKSKLSLWRQTAVLTRRALLENFRNRSKFFRGIMSRLPASIMIGCFFWQIGAVSTQESIFPLKGIFFLTVQNPLIETFYAGATTIQHTKSLLKREYYDGLYQVTPFYLSYFLSFLAMQIPWAFVWASPLYVLVGMPLELARFGVFVLTGFLVILMACAAGSAVGTRTKDADGNRAVLMPMIIPMVLFSGYVIPYSQISRVWKFVYYLSPVQWGMTLLETNQYKGIVFTDCDPSVSREAGRRCFATGEEYLASTTSQLAQNIGIPGMLLVCTGYLVLGLLVNIRMIRVAVLDGRI